MWGGLSQGFFLPRSAWKVSQQQPNCIFSPGKREKLLPSSHTRFLFGEPTQTASQAAHVLRVTLLLPAHSWGPRHEKMSFSVYFLCPPSTSASL